MELSMEKKDKRIRMQWLIGLAVSLVIGISGILYEIQLIPANPLLPHYHFVMLIFSLIGMFGISFFFYRCAYRKPGTKLLFLVLLINGFSLTTSPIAFFSGGSFLSSYARNSYGSFFLTMITGITWFILCLRMRRLNQRLSQEQLKVQINNNLSK